jgi:DNA-directed RNA polymerase subunit RPC12/RpoP
MEFKVVVRCIECDRELQTDVDVWASVRVSDGPSIDISVKPIACEECATKIIEMKTELNQ